MGRNDPTDRPTRQPRGAQIRVGSTRPTDPLSGRSAGDSGSENIFGLSSPGPFVHTVHFSRHGAFQEKHGAGASKLESLLKTFTKQNKKTTRPTDPLHAQRRKFWVVTTRPTDPHGGRGAPTSESGQPDRPTRHAQHGEENLSRKNPTDRPSLKPAADA